MAANIRFDENYNPLPPTLVLATRSNKKLGVIKATNINYIDSLYTDELSFQVNKYNNGEKEPLWDKIKNFKTVWCKEWDQWFSITVEIDETNDTIKNVSAQSLGEVELGQIMLYDIEINTETDISRDEYVVTKIYDPDNTEGSLLHRITEKAGLYSFGHVDENLASLQRTFTFDDVALYDALSDICEEIDALLVIDSSTNELTGKPMRTISLYDLDQVCSDCGYRGEFTDVCPECGSTNIVEGYGEDTTIFVSAENLGEDITFTTDTDAVKNCFKLIAGDDLMTATVRNCLPTGSDYIYTFTDEDKEDMSDELVARINSYDELYNYYQNEYEMTATNLSAYNSLVTKYQAYDPELTTLSSPITGYSELMLAQYEIIDFLLYLQSSLMPDASLDDTDAETEAAKLTIDNINTVAVSDASYISLSTASSNVLAVAKIIVDSRYQVKVNESSLDDTIWTGNFTVTNYSDEEDTAVSETIFVVINDDYETYVRQKLEKSLNSEDDSELYDISGLFSADLDTFKIEIKKYCLNRLTSFYDAGQSCLDILIEQGIGDKETWADGNPDLYEELYYPYYLKIQALEEEIALRESEIATATELQGELTDIQGEIQEALDFETYLGEDLWKEFLLYRREDSYTNDNYISDGLSNTEIFEYAQTFIKVATNELYKSANMQHSISSTLKNLLVLAEFKPLVKHFEVGNWLRLRVDDNIYKLRLIEYTVDFESLDSLSVTFSDVTTVKNGYSDVASILAQASSMATSYSSVAKQASDGSETATIIDHWVSDGLDLTNQKIVSSATGQTQTWDSHGMLFRKQTDETDEYEDTQMKIINSTLAITDDGWETVKTALGEYYYENPTTGNYTKAYGLIAETIVGELIIGENLGIYTSNGSMTFDENGLVIDTSSGGAITITNGKSNQMYIDSSGNATFAGSLSATNGYIGAWTITSDNLYTQFSIQNSEFVEQQVMDEDGNPVYVTEYVYDSNGNPVYETDDDGNIIYETTYMYDDDGSPVYKTDEDGNIIYEITYVYDDDGNPVYDYVTEYVYDENGDPVYETDEDGNIVYDEDENPSQQTTEILVQQTVETPVQQTTETPVQKSQQVAVMETVEVLIDSYYNNYTILNTRGINEEIALAVGAVVGSDGDPDPDTGLAKIYNTGKITGTSIYVDNGSGDPSLYWNRTRSNGNVTTARIYSMDSDTPALAFAFRNSSSSSYTYSVKIDKNGVLPYYTNTYSLGTSSSIWNALYVKNATLSGTLAVSGATTLKSTLSVANTLTTRNILPYATTTYNLGSSSYRYNYVYAKYLNTSGSATIGGTITTRSVLPYSTKAYNLGSSSYRYNYLYAQHLNISSSSTLSGAVTLKSTMTVSKTTYLATGGGAVYSQSHMLVRPSSTLSKSNTGRAFQVQVNASNTWADRDDTSKVLISCGFTSTTAFFAIPTTYELTSSSSANIRISSSGVLYRYESSASRYKNTINYFGNVDYASPEGLAKRDYTVEESDYRDDYRAILKFPVVQFHYNTGYMTGEPDYDYTKYVTGFIAEDIAALCPACATYTEDGQIEAWNHMEMIPRIVACVQDLDKDTKCMNEEIILLKMQLAEAQMEIINLKNQLKI